MFKQFKSALFWYYIYRFRSRVALIVTLIFLILFSQFIYSDIVEYLKLRHKLQWLDYILPLKWIVILGSVFAIIYLLATIFSKERQKNTKEAPSHEPKKLSKKEIRQRAQELIEKKRQSKIHH